MLESNVSYLTKDGTKTTDREVAQREDGTMEDNSKTKRARIFRCGVCSLCTLPDCDACRNCLDKPRNGGAGVRKKMCIKRANCQVRMVPKGAQFADALKLKD